MEKIKENIIKYKYHISGFLVLILCSLIYNKLKSNTEDEIKEETKNIIKKNEDKLMFDMIYEEFKKLNKSLIKLNPSLIKDKEKTEFYDKLFKKDIIKKLILIDSLSISESINYNTSNYKITFGKDGFADVYKNVIGFRLVKATLPNMAYQVDKNNSKFIVNTGSPNPLNLTEGSYNFINLGYHIEDIINTISGLNVTVIPNISTFKYEISGNINFKFEWKSSNSLSYKLFGANLTDNDEAIFYTENNIYKWSSKNIVDQTKHFVDLVIPEIPSISTKKSLIGRDVIDRIPLTTPSGSLVYYFSPVTEYSSINYFYPVKLSSLTIQLYDHNSNKFYDTKNGNNYFEFELTILNDTSKMN
tara:strand:+ start:860 stop:1936 length:1077 start_codon:yes stop_codon:yes gene_type:complete